MAKCKYYAKENKKVGTHSFYAVSVPNGTLTFDEVCEEACENTSIEPSFMKAAGTEYTDDSLVIWILIAVMLAMAGAAAGFIVLKVRK